MCDNALAPGEPAKIVPIRKVYIVLNSVSLIHVDMVTHALITEAAAARQRGMTILADTGSRESITMSLPLSGDIGLIQVGQLIEVPDPDGTWRGPVRSLALSAKRDDQAGLSIWQTIGLERHYG